MSSTFLRWGGEGGGEVRGHVWDTESLVVVVILVAGGSAALSNTTIWGGKGKPVGYHGDEEITSKVTMETTV